MVPTRVAEELWPEVSAGLARFAAGLAAREGFDPARAQARFRIGMGDYALSLFAAALAGSVMEDAPGVTLELVAAVPGVAEDDLAMGRLDLLVGPVWANRGRFHAVPLLEQRFVGLVGRDHPLAGAAPPTLEDFAGAPHILTSSRGRVPGNVDAGLDRLGLNRHVAVTVPSFEEAARICARGQGVLSCGHTLAEVLARTHDLVTFPLPLEVPGFTLAVRVRPENTPSPSLRWLVDKLREACREQPQGRAIGE